MEMHQLLHFVVAARCEKLLAASRELKMSQPALTRSVGALEKSLGVPLFERDPRGVRLTPYGKRFLVYAQAILNERKSAFAELNAMRKGIFGKVSVGISSLYTLNIVPLALAQLLTDHPNVEVAVQEGNFEELRPTLQNGDLDFLLTIVPDGIADSALIFEQLIEERLIVVGRPGHPLVPKRKIAAEEAVAYPWIISDQLLLEDKVTKQFFLRYGISIDTNTIINAKSIPFRKAAIQRSDVLSLMPAYTIADELANGELVRIPMPRLEHSVPAGLVYSSHGVRSRIVDELMDCIRVASGATSAGRTSKQRIPRSAS